MMEVYRDTCTKVNEARAILFPPAGETTADVHDAGTILVTMYSPPRKLINHLAFTWHVDTKWVRNTLVG